MNWLPRDYEADWTLKGVTSREGICLHTGEKSEVTLLPYQKAGFYVSWGNKKNSPIRLHPDQVVNSPLCTALNLGGRSLATVEHLLAALIGCGLTHVHIHVSGKEIPILDGSSLGWIEAINEVGLSQVNSSRSLVPILQKPLLVNKGASFIAAIPSDVFRLIGIIDFPYQAIGKQMYSLDLTPSAFVKELAPARTFGFKDQIEQLIANGLIKGGNLNNSLVCDGKSWVNPPLRFKDEPVRHKLLDLIGDLALIGLPKAQVLVYRGSHALHAELSKTLTRECSLTQAYFD